jgi:hypothetical protein
MISQDNPITDIPAPSFNSDGSPKSPLVSTPEACRGIHLENWYADSNNRLFRAWVQSMLEGKPPNDPALMRAAGLQGCSNINWLDGQLAIRKKMIPYVEMLNSLPTFLNIKTEYGTNAQRVQWGKVMSECHARVMRSWRPFVPRYLYNVLYLVSHGASFCYFPDCNDWRWNVSTLGDMVIPRLTRADASEFQVVSTVRQFTPSELWKRIKNSKKGDQWTKEEEQGWHVPTVRQKMEKAVGRTFFKANDWELSERLWKDNELYYNRSAKTCACVVMWVEETDGSVTQLICSEDAVTGQGLKNEQFLSREYSYFQNMQDGLIVFTRDIGTNGDFHSIRGTGNDIFPLVQQMNRMKNSMFDALEVEMSIPVRASSEVLSTELAYTKAGPFMPLYDGMEIVERKAANYSNSAFPGMEMINRNFLEQTGQLPQGLPSGSNMDFEGLLGALSGIDVMESTLFHLPWQSLLRNSLGRMIRIKSTAEDGGREAFEFRKLCMKRGVPKEAIDQIDIEGSNAVRAIGNGSPQSKLFAMNAMKEVVTMFDEEGKNKWLRSYLGSLPGISWEQVDDFAPEVEGMRPDQNVRNAIFENDILQRGGVAPVLPNDEHIIHLQQHLEPMMQIVQSVEEGMPEDEAVQPLYPLYMHANEHLQMAGDEPLIQNQLASIRQAMQTMGEIIVNGQRKAEAKQKKAEENAAKGLDPDGNPLPDGGGLVNGERPIFNGLTGTELKLFTEAQIKLQQAGRSAQIREEQHQLSMAAKKQEVIDKAAAAKTNRSLADYKTAAQIQGMKQGQQLKAKQVEASIAAKQSTKKTA